MNNLAQQGFWLE